MKFASINSAGESFALRAEADFKLQFPQLSLVKQIVKVNGAAIGPATSATVKGGSEVEFALTVKNAGEVAALNTEVRDLLAERDRLRGNRRGLDLEQRQLHLRGDHLGRNRPRSGSDRRSRSGSDGAAFQRQALHRARPGDDARRQSGRARVPQRDEHRRRIHLHPRRKHRSAAERKRSQRAGRQRPRVAQNRRSHAEQDPHELGQRNRQQSSTKRRSARKSPSKSPRRSPPARRSAASPKSATPAFPRHD